MHVDADVVIIVHGRDFFFFLSPFCVCARVKAALILAFGNDQRTPSSYKP